MWLVQIMMIVALGTIIYVICIALSQKHIGTLIVLLTVFSIIGVVVETVTPVINDVKAKVEKVEQQIERVENLVDKVTGRGHRID